jgi:inosine/xanthosine triphosphatase
VGSANKGYGCVEKVHPWGLQQILIQKIYRFALFHSFMRRISVGSQNPVKIQAVTSAVNKIWDNTEVIAVKCPSGVSIQPTSDDEAIKGAVTRAHLSLQKTGADVGIGLEGSINDTGYGMFVTGWVAAVDKAGTMGIGGGGKLLLPEDVAAKVRTGKELGPVMDEFVGEYNTKQKQGAVGIFTGNLVTRADAFERAVIYALTRFINPGYYTESTERFD